MWLKKLNDWRWFVTTNRPMNDLWPRGEIWQAGSVIKRCTLTEMWKGHTKLDSAIDIHFPVHGVCPCISKYPDVYIQPLLFTLCIQRFVESPKSRVSFHNNNNNNNGWYEEKYSELENGEDNGRWMRDDFVKTPNSVEVVGLLTGVHWSPSTLLRPASQC